MARVKVRMYATVRETAGTSGTEVDAADLEGLLRELACLFGAPLSQLLEDSESLVILLNGRNVRPGSVHRVKFEDGDEISIFPPVSGG